MTRRVPALLLIGVRALRQHALRGALGGDPWTLMDAQRQLRGSSQDERSDLFEALQLVAKGKVKPAIETYPLGEANKAFARLASGKVRYRAVLLHG